MFNNFLTFCNEGIRIILYVQPKASKDEIAGLHGSALKLRITAPPVEGAANEACIKFLAKLLKRPPSSLMLTAGQNSRQKQVLVIRKKNETPENLMKEIREKLQGHFPA